MNKNIRDYMNNNATGKSANEKVENNIPTEAEMKKNLNQFSRMNERDLMMEMNKLASQGKADGNLNEESLRQFYTQVSPMLTEQQRNKLKQLINSLK